MKRTEFAADVKLPELFAKRVDYDRALFEAFTLLHFNNKADPFAANMSGCHAFEFAAALCFSQRLRKLDGREPIPASMISAQVAVLQNALIGPKRIADCTGVLQTIYDHAIKAAFAFED